MTCLKLALPGIKSWRRHCIYNKIWHYIRFLDTLESKTFISYYSYHKPIVSSISLENRQSITIEPVDDNNVDVELVPNIESVAVEPEENS